MLKRPSDNPSNLDDENEADEAEMFADDTTVASIADTVDELIPKIQMAANQVQNWSLFNGMVIHPGKTKVMVISKRKFIGPIQNVAMNGRDLEIVESQKVLGVTIDNSLNWKAHFDKVLKHFRTKIKMLKNMIILGNEAVEKF